MVAEAPQQSSTLFYSNLSQRLLNTRETPLSWETHPIACKRSKQMYLDKINSTYAPLKHIVQVYVV